MWREEYELKISIPQISRNPEEEEGESTCQVEWKTPGEQDTLNQISNVSSQTESQSQVLYGSAPYPLHIYLHVLIIIQFSA